MISATICDIWVVGMEVLPQNAPFTLGREVRSSPYSGFLSDAETHVEPSQPSDSVHIACDKLAFCGPNGPLPSSSVACLSPHLPCLF